MTEVEKEFKQFLKDEKYLQKIYNHYEGKGFLLSIKERQNIIQRFGFK